MTKELKEIKKKYGEAMMHFCRKNFPTILNQENALISILLNNFYPTKELYNDLIIQGIENEFIIYINSLYNPRTIVSQIECDKSPKEIFEEIGYDFFECHTNEDILSFKKYYTKEEELCSFIEDRISRCHVFFAIRKDIDKIKREDFKNPQRQDEYGTSAMSIQFAKDKSHTLSIKNRYNHIVENADATFSNNLDNIYPGLSYAFAKTYGLKQNENKNNEFKIDGYVRANNGKLYKYNYALSNIYYCTNNIIIDNGIVKEYEHEKYIIMDIYVLDLVNKKIYSYDSTLIDTLYGIFTDIEIIKINKLIDGKELFIRTKKDRSIYLRLDRNNNIIEFISNDIKELPEYFMFFNNKLRKLITPNVIEIKNAVLWSNTELEEINIKNARLIGEYFLPTNNKLKSLDISLVEFIGSNFLKNNKVLEEIKAISLKRVKDYFLSSNKGLNEIDFPCLEDIGINFLENNPKIKIATPNIHKR